jgi:hypothetical protein
VEIVEVEAALERVKAQLGPADFELFKRLFDTLVAVTAILNSSRAMLSRLRRLFGLQSTERSRSLPGASGAEDSAAETPGSDKVAAEAAEADEPKLTAAEPDRPAGKKGHGRLPTSVYTAATHIVVPHPELQSGGPCPDCRRGKLYELRQPACVLRIFGQPLLSATCWDCQRLRCSSCSSVHTAQAPPEAQGPKFDATAVAMIAVARYGIGLPHHRLARLQHHLSLPVPASTQWEALDDNASAFELVFAELQRHAAQGEILHTDDTYARLLAFMGRRRAKLLQSGQLPNPDRVGLYTTGVVSLTNGQPTVLFYTGRAYAGENVADLLLARAQDLAPPTLMSDGLDSRNIPAGHAVIESNCLTHARRGFVDQLNNFPNECRHVIGQLREVYRVESECKDAELSPDQRLARHQHETAPIMAELKTWIEAQLNNKIVEPNSELGKAYKYVVKRWDRLTLFLRKAGVPIDNNLCERVLKMSIRHRRNSLFYRSERGAEVGDMFMSLIYTAELRGENPFEYLTAVIRNDKAVAQHPADWLPWNYRATLARLELS